MCLAVKLVSLWIIIPHCHIKCVSLTIWKWDSRTSLCNRRAVGCCQPPSEVAEHLGFLCTLCVAGKTEKIFESNNELRTLTPGDVLLPETFVYLNNLNRPYKFQGLVLLVMALVKGGRGGQPCSYVATLPPLISQLMLNSLLAGKTQTLSSRGIYQPLLFLQSSITNTIIPMFKLWKLRQMVQVNSPKIPTFLSDTEWDWESPLLFIAGCLSPYWLITDTLVFVAKVMLQQVQFISQTGWRSF